MRSWLSCRLGRWERRPGAAMCSLITIVVLLQRAAWRPGPGPGPRVANGAGAAEDEILPREDGDILRIGDGPPPSAEDISAILTRENKLLGGAGGWNATTIEKMSAIYELTYAFVAGFRRHGIPIVLGFGSHIGARRHHGIIPFGEKDVDFQVFSLDESKVLSIIRETLQSNRKWSRVKVDETEFGYQLQPSWMADHGFSHYIDFWLFDAYDDPSDGRRRVKCIGRTGNFTLSWVNTKFTKGCDRWYNQNHGRDPPEFAREDYFPALSQVFGTHRVPIPAGTADLETFQYGGTPWNTTCGAHRTWNGRAWEDVPRLARRCEDRHDRYPFVFRTGNGTEELRRGAAVIHRSASS